MGRRLTPAIVAWVFVLLATSPALAAPGDLDPSFGHHGKVTTDVAGGDDSAAGVAVDDDGKIVVAGVAEKPAGDDDFVVARYLTDGSLDETFGGDGVVTTDLGSNDAARALAIEPDGDIVVAGTSSQPETGWDFALVRYTPTGTLDDAFGDHGVVLTDFDNQADGASALVLAPGGDIVLAGESHADFALARYHDDGSPDNGFDGDGRLTTDFAGRPDAANVVAIQGGEILAGGYAVTSGDYRAQDVALARYEADGGLDATFGDSGLVTTDVAEDDAATGIAVRPDGRFVVANAAPYISGNERLLGYLADGTPDPGFDNDGNRGKLVPHAVELDAKGKIIVAGATPAGCCGYGDFAVARYASTGELDKTFAPSPVLTDFGFVVSDTGRAVALQENGRIVVAGASDGDLALARYRVDRGPANADADRVRDADDKCPLYPGPRPTGCATVGRTISLDYGFEFVRQGFFGEISSDAPACRSAHVVVFKKRRGPDLEIGKFRVSAGTSRLYSSEFFIKAAPEPGRYYASVHRAVRHKMALCDEAHSPLYTIEAGP